MRRALITAAAGLVLVVGAACGVSQGGTSAGQVEHAIQTSADAQSTDISGVHCTPAGGNEWNCKATANGSPVTFGAAVNGNEIIATIGGTP